MFEGQLLRQSASILGPVKKEKFLFENGTNAVDKVLVDGGVSETMAHEARSVPSSPTMSSPRTPSLTAGLFTQQSPIEANAPFARISTINKHVATPKVSANSSKKRARDTSKSGGEEKEGLPEPKRIRKPRRFPRVVRPKKELVPLVEYVPRNQERKRIETPIAKDGKILSLKFCAECAVLDLENGFTPRPTGRYEPKLLRSWTRKTLTEDERSCELCDLFEAFVSDPEYDKVDTFWICYDSASSRLRLAPPGESQSTSDAVVLGVYLPYDIELDEPSESSLSGLGIIAPGYVDISEPTNFNYHPINPTNIDFSVPLSWLHECQRYHDCGSGAEKDHFPIKLIDCDKNEIILADTSYKYAALSYVWGQQDELTPPTFVQKYTGNVRQDLDQLLNAPRTIKDAITATQKLNLRYLWVDRHCINQKNASEKHTQIAAMHLIYRSAEVTLVAACGDDDSFGLPGVGLTPRISLPEVTIGSLRLGLALPNPAQLLSKSRWASRAWTYQEALLSRRRLIFTTREVYLECQCARYCESLDSNLRGVDDRLPPTDLMRIPTTADQWEIYQCISEYSKRELSYDSDALYGVFGVLEIYQSLSQGNLHQICGIPIIPFSAEEHEARLEPTSPTIGSLKRSYSEFSRDEAVGSRLAESFIEGLLWDLETSGRRRHQFPSWCWTGWAGEVAFHQIPTDRPIAISGEISIELRNNKRRRLNDPQWTQSLDRSGDSDDTPRYLRFTTYIQPIRIQGRPDCIPNEGNSPYYARLSIKSPTRNLQSYFRVTLFQSDHVSTPPGDVVAILWPPGRVIVDAERSVWDESRHLPLVQIENGVAERIGTLHLHNMYLCDEKLHSESPKELSADVKPHFAVKQHQLGREGFERFGFWDWEEMIEWESLPILTEILLG